MSPKKQTEMYPVSSSAPSLCCFCFGWAVFAQKKKNRREPFLIRVSYMLSSAGSSRNRKGTQQEQHGPRPRAALADAGFTGPGQHFPIPTCWQPMRLLGSLAKLLQGSAWRISQTRSPGPQTPHRPLPECLCETQGLHTNLTLWLPY